MSDENTPSMFTQMSVHNPSPFLAACVREGSNREADWMWAAGQVQNINEKCYCLHRVLHINPKNRVACRQLEALLRAAQRPTTTVRAYREKEGVLNGLANAFSLRYGR